MCHTDKISYSVIIIMLEMTSIFVYKIADVKLPTIVFFN